MNKTLIHILIICFFSINSFSQNINVTGLTNDISDGDTTPVTTDNTDFGSIMISSSVVHTFVVMNTDGPSGNTLTINNISLSGVNAADFTVTSSITTIPKNFKTDSFTITFTPSAAGPRIATVIIDNDSSIGTEQPYTFDIVGVGLAPPPEIEIQGNATIITDGDATPILTDHTDFGSVSTGSSLDRTYTIYNTSTVTSILNLTGGVPLVAISGDASFTIFTQPIASTINGGNSLTFVVRFAPLVGGTVTGTISIDNDDSDENPYTFVIQGTGAAPLTKGPGGITTDLQLWLKSTDGLGYLDGQGISLWEDQGRGSNATVNTIGQEPTFRDNSTRNINFNAVVDFDNVPNSPNEIDYSYLPQEYLEGIDGFYTQEMYVVALPNGTVDSSTGAMDMFTGDADSGANDVLDKDVTGVGYGMYSDRFDPENEIISYCINTTPGTVPADINDRGYGVSHTSNIDNYTSVGIINARNNSSLTSQELYYNAYNIVNTEVGLNNFINVSDSRFWIGRSQSYRASFDGRIAEIITFSARNDDTTTRPKIESYLAIKYGITLGVNGVSQDYVNSNGDIIWDISANAGFNYNIAGIGQDDDSELIQKQSKSVNTGSVVAIGLGEVAITNNDNPNNFVANLDFLVWGSDNGDFNTTSEVAQNINLSGSTTTFTPVSRKWKILETQNDVSEVVISIVTADLTSNIPLAANEEYMLVVADDASFGNTNIIDVVPLIEKGSNSEVWYDFDGIKYFTIAKATRVEEKRRVDFSAGDFIIGECGFQLNSTFTASAWVKNNGSGGSFISKGSLIEGYNFKINNSNYVEIDWNGSTQFTSTNTIDSNWHHIAISYTGGTANLYIDGILDKTVNSLVDPVSSKYKLTIGARYLGKTDITSFDGSIDEVRFWEVALTVDEIRYILNQEIELFGTNVDGEVLPQSITKNDINSRSWSSLMVYYDMNSYYGTAVEDNSSNTNWGRIKYLTKDKQIVESQTAPLPYESVQVGNWDTAATWLNNTVQYLPNTTLYGTQIDWNIVETNNDVNTTRNVTVLGLKNNVNELSINADNSLTVSHYLLLNGVIDLDGESQLIQTEGSDLDVLSAGYLERDQQGTANSFNYNYWSSSVGPIGAGSNNANYTLSQILNDGTDPVNPGVINFSSSYNAADLGVSSPINISTYWLYTFNGTSDDYYSWASIDENSNLLAGEGYTMKGSSGNITIATNQNYVFKGKPNNADITLPIVAGNNRLIGNPYASAIDADEFIKDNIKETINSGIGRNTVNVFNGALYFWHHFGEENSHILKEYVGGYATYTLMGGTEAISNDSRINDNLSLGGKAPERYIPVGQGFFVNAYLPSSIAGTTATVDGGDIIFKNSQRIFQKEISNSGNGSVFFKSTTINNKNIKEESVDTRPKIKLIFDSPEGYHRQLLIGADENTSNGFDMGYDAPLADIGKEDMFWLIDESKLVIQAVANFNKDQEFPIGIKIENDGLVRIKVDTLENFKENNPIFIKDYLTGRAYPLKHKAFEINLEKGEHLDRFALTFHPHNKPLKDRELVNEEIIVNMNNKVSELQVNKVADTEITNITLLNYLGQTIETWNGSFNNQQFSIPINISPGVYIVIFNTTSGTISKKIIID